MGRNPRHFQPRASPSLRARQRRCERVRRSRPLWRKHSTLGSACGSSETSISAATVWCPRVPSGSSRARRTHPTSPTSSRSMDSSTPSKTPSSSPRKVSRSMLHGARSLAALLALAALLPAAAWARRTAPSPTPPPPTPTPVPAATPLLRPSTVRDTHVASGELWLRLRERLDPAATPPPAAVLFVHGSVFPGVPTFDRDNADSWLGAALAKGLDPFALDLDGYGESMPPLARDVASLPRAVGDVAAAVAAIAASHPRGVALVGYDYGADIAALYAATHPVTALVLVAPLLQPDPIESETVLTAPMLRSWLGEEVSEAVAQRAIAMALLGTRDAGRREPAALVVPAGVFASTAQPPLTPNLVASLSMPTLLVRGRLDAIFDGDAAHALANGGAHVTVIEVPGDHRLPWEPGGAEAARRIADFLSATGTKVH
ncbi:alpha/beta fold hydrolase [bacterium]|nr:MAG: alpha/beta fold hydrolase [bacterium]